VLAVMVWSGMLIYWANDVYRLGWGDKTVLKFFPTSFYKALHIPFRLAEGMSLHFVFMWLFAINGLVYFLYLIFSGEWRLIFPNKRSLKESFLVILHDLRIRKSIPLQKKYNAAQRIAYTIVIFMGLGSILTGISIYKPTQFHTLTYLLGGYEWARIEHFTLTILFCLFFLVHVVQVALAGWNNFQSMVTGLFVVEKNVIPIVQSQPVIKIEEENETETVTSKSCDDSENSNEEVPGDPGKK
jgi:thiosulfate reductase cytochrome b subunit